MRSYTGYGLLILTFGLLTAGCTDFSNDPEQEHFYGSGNVVSQQRSVGAFTGIRITNFGTVSITQSDTESLQVEVDDNLADRVVASVQNGILLVGLKPGSYEDFTLRFIVSMKTIKSLEITGAGEMSSASPIQTDNLKCTIIGTGTITLAGTATSHTALITGAGNIHNFDLTSNDCSATVAGTGNIEVTATQSLTALVTGVGTIVYDGNPPSVNTSVVGVGTIQPR